MFTLARDQRWSRAGTAQVAGTPNLLEPSLDERRKQSGQVNSLDLRRSPFSATTLTQSYISFRLRSACVWRHGVLYCMNKYGYGLRDMDG